MMSEEPLADCAGIYSNCDIMSRDLNFIYPTRVEAGIKVEHLFVFLFIKHDEQSLLMKLFNVRLNVKMDYFCTIFNSVLSNHNNSRLKCLEKQNRTRLREGRHGLFMILSSDEPSEAKGGKDVVFPLKRGRGMEQVTY